MKLRKLKQQIEKQVIEIFPTIPKINITAYIHHHPSLSAVEFIVHFLEIAEPTKKNLDLETELLLAQARQIIQHREAEEENNSDILESEESSSVLEKQKIVNMFEIPNSCQKLSSQLFQSINKFRFQKKRSKLQDEDYLNRLSFVYAKELESGYISLDSNEWTEWLKSHPDIKQLTDTNFYCGFIPQVANPVQSITQMIEEEKDLRQIILSTVRFCSIGISISKNFSVFFVIFIADRK